MSVENYVFVCPDEVSRNKGVELPLEEDGTLLLSVLQSQFEGATGIKYRNEATGGWRAVRLANGALYQPEKGWQGLVFVVVLATTKGDAAAQNTEGVEVSVAHPEEEYAAGAPPSSSDSGKRKLEDQEGPRASKNPRSQSPENYPSNMSPTVPEGESNLNQEDMIVLGLEYSITKEELKAYFEQFGVVTHCEVKMDRYTGKSRGFGFVRFGDRQIQEKVFEKQDHSVKGRHVDLRFPKQSSSYIPSKLFIGCMPSKPYEVSVAELSEYFGQFGRLADVYIPNPFRGFGFVTFVDPTVAQKVVNMQHAIRKQVLNVAYADPKSPGRGGNYQSNNPPQFNSSTDYGPPSSMSRPQGPLPRYYSAPQPPAHQGYGVPDFRQGPVHDGSTPVRNTSGGHKGGSSGQMPFSASHSDQNSHQPNFGQQQQQPNFGQQQQQQQQPSNWQMR